MMRMRVAAIVMAFLCNHVIATAQSASVVKRDMQDAEILFFRGDFDEAVDRIRNARDGLRELHLEAVKSRRVDVDLQYQESVLDTLQAQIRTAQGFHRAARDLLERTEKRLQRRAAALAKGGASVNDLAAYNYQLGFVRLCLGEVALEEAVIDGVIRQTEPSRKKCAPYFEEGDKIIRGTFRQSDYTDFDLQLRLVNYCELRLAHMMIIDGDVRRARTFFDDARELLETDVYWAEQFAPDGQAKVFSNGVGGLAKAAPPAGKGGEAGAPANAASTPPTGTASAAGSRETPPVQTSLVTATDQSLDASATDRHRIRTALFYVQLLGVQAELESLAGRPSLAEEAASRARDIAEEQCYNSVVHAHALMSLSNIYCTCFEKEMESATSVDARSNRSMRTTQDVHAIAAQSYLADAKEFIAEAEKIAAKANAAQSIHFKILDVRRRIEKLRNDKSSLKALDDRCRAITDERQDDKPKREQ
jgi:hypothetical protein